MNYELNLTYYQTGGNVEVFADGYPTTDTIFPEGTEITLLCTPIDEDYYFDFIRINGTIVADEDSLKPYRYVFTLTESVDIYVDFNERDEYELTLEAPEGYQAIGGGTYKYLEEVTIQLIIDDFSAFAGWYFNDELLSMQNPYVHFIPDFDVTLEARVNTDIFENLNVRQFA